MPQAIVCYLNIAHEADNLVRNDSNVLINKGISAIDIALMCDWLTEQQKQSSHASTL